MISKLIKWCLITIGLLLIPLGIWIEFQNSIKIEDQTSSNHLAPDVTEKIIIDPARRTLRRITPEYPSGRTLILPDRPSSVELLKDGTLRVTARQWGPELKPFAGAGFAGKKALAIVGVDMLYYKRFDLGLSLGPDDKSFRIGALVSYNFYSHLRMSIGLDNTQAVGGYLTVRF